MYESFYGLKEKPFTLLPDPDYLYLSPKHQRALTLLEYGMMNQAGFSVICGDTGAGKTTLIRRLLTELGDDTTVGLITNTHQSFGELLNWVLMAFGIDSDGKSKAQMHQMFISFLIEQYAANKHTVLIVDEAQNMNAATLEELRMLSNINADKDQVLQVILAGQPALRETLRQPELMQFAQRIAVDYYLESLSEEETAQYIQHRLKIAGAEKDIFTPEACSAIYKYSGGTPRLINLLCDTTLVYGFAEQTSIIGKQLVDDVVREQHSNSIVPTFNTPGSDVQAVRASQAEQNISQASSQANAQAAINNQVNDSVVSGLDQQTAQLVSNSDAQANVGASHQPEPGDAAVVEVQAAQTQKEIPESNVTPIKQDLEAPAEDVAASPEQAVTEPETQATAEPVEKEDAQTQQLDAERLAEPVEETGAAGKINNQESVAAEQVEPEPAMDEQFSSAPDGLHYEKAYPIIQVEEGAKKNFNALVLGLAGGMFLASLMMVGYVVFSGMNFGQPQQVQQIVSPPASPGDAESERRAEIEQARLEAMQKERDAALALTKALERERDAAIASAKVQEEMRAAEQRAAEIIAEQERRTARQIQEAKKRARQAELAAIRAEERERLAREKADKIKQEAEAARIEAARLDALKAEQQKSVPKQQVVPAVTTYEKAEQEVIQAVAESVEKPVAKKSEKTTKFSANPCSSPSAKFLSTCKK